MLFYIPQFLNIKHDYFSKQKEKFYALNQIKTLES